MKSSTEMDLWNRRHELWRTFAVSKPRQARSSDESIDWVMQLRPLSLQSFKGPSTRDACEVLKRNIELFEQSGFLRHTIFVGKGGVGKSSLSTLFIQELLSNAGIELEGGDKADRRNLAKVLCRFDGEDAEACSSGAVSRSLAQFYGRSWSEDVFPYRLIWILHAERMAPSSQLVVKRYLQDYETTRLILGTEDVSALVEGLSKATWKGSGGNPFEEHYLSPLDDEMALRCLLSFLKRERVGHTIEGIRTLVDQVKIRNPLDAKKRRKKRLKNKEERRKMILEASNSQKGYVNMRDLLMYARQTFVRYHFLSKENVGKVFGLKEASSTPSFPSSTILIPLTRCSLCTLPPPCSHVTQEQLHEQALDRLAELPRYEGGLVCRHFLQTGTCPFFNRFSFFTFL